jgi:hypothetical protein
MLAGMEGVGHVPSVYRTLRDQPPRELAIARVAERQHNLIHLTQLQALELSANAVRKRAAQGACIAPARRLPRSAARLGPMEGVAKE